MTMHLLPVSPGPSVLPIPTATAPPNLPKQWWCSIAQCIAHRASTPEPRWPQINPREQCLGLQTPHCCTRVRAPTPGRRQSPFQRCLLCRTRAWAMGCVQPRQPRTATCDLSADAPHQSTARNSHGTAAAMRARIAGPSITHSSNKAWRTGGD
jgi:hypothetical protein